LYLVVYYWVIGIIQYMYVNEVKYAEQHLIWVLFVGFPGGGSFTRSGVGGDAGGSAGSGGGNR